MILATYLSFPQLSHRQGSHPCKAKIAHLDLYGSMPSRNTVDSVYLDINIQLEYNRLCTLVATSFVPSLPDMTTNSVGLETMRFVDITGSCVIAEYF